MEMERREWEWKGGNGENGMGIEERGGNKDEREGTIHGASDSVPVCRIGMRHSHLILLWAHPGCWLLTDSDALTWKGYSSAHHDISRSAYFVPTSNQNILR